MNTHSLFTHSFLAVFPLALPLAQPLHLGSQYFDSCYLDSCYLRPLYFGSCYLTSYFGSHTSTPATSYRWDAKCQQ